MKFLLQKNNKFQKNLILFIFFGFFFIIGSNIFNQYGVSIDEGQLRDLGFITLNYIYEFFPQLKLDLVKDIPASANLQEWHSKDHGAFLETLFAFIESFYNIEENIINESEVRITLSNEDLSETNNTYKEIINEKIIQENLSYSLTPNENNWNKISMIANRTFVPESEESRNKGAGGGDAND